MSLQDLAYNNVNNLGDPSSITYGSEPFNPKTWDADMIYGCKADSYGYYHHSSPSSLQYTQPATGYDLSMIHCPKSYNPRVLDTDIRKNSTNGTLSYNYQSLTCTASSGHFSLSFRGESTGVIQSNHSINYLKTQLESLRSIGYVSIRTTYDASLDSQICDRSGDTTIVISFLTELGNIPSLQLKNMTLSPTNSLYIDAGVNPMSYLYECGGRGECNKLNGRCLCWDKWSTSDGFGNDGILGDCGANLIR